MENTEHSFEEEFNTDVQKKFIGLLVQDKLWAELNGFGIITPDLFENRILHNICQWIHSYYKKRKDIPTKLILKEKAKELTYEGKAKYNDYFLYEQALEDIYTIEGGEAAKEEWKEKAIKFVRNIKWKQALANGSTAFDTNNVEQAIEKFKEVLTIGSENDLGIDLSERNVDDFLIELGQTYDKTNMIHTGIPGWDAALGGGFVKDNLHIIGAQPGGGKSKLMAFLAKQALMESKKVIFITLELSEVETEANMRISFSGISFSDMLNPIYKQEFETKNEIFSKTFSQDCIIKFYKPATVTADTITNFIQKVIQYKKEKYNIDWKPDVIFLDYLDKLLPTQKVKGSLYEDIGGVADDCKNLAITFHCPVITGSQLGRATWNIKGSEVISLDSLAESARKAHLAHTITTINYNPGEKAVCKARLFMAKSRSGKPGTTIYIENNLTKCLMYEVDPWDPDTLQGTVNYSIKSSAGGTK